MKQRKNRNRKKPSTNPAQIISTQTGKKWSQLLDNTTAGYTFTRPWRGSIETMKTRWPLTKTGLLLIVLWPFLCAAGLYWQWQELLVICVVCLLILVYGWWQTRGENRLLVEIELEKTRLKRGQDVRGKLVVTNPKRIPASATNLELPVGENRVIFTLPSLGARKTWKQEFAIPARHRELIQVGPARTVKTDFFGLYRREQAWSGSQEVYVHPNYLPQLGNFFGYLRDIEGQVTNVISQSDVAFHALRPYQMGDDRRHIHWRMSAHSGELMMRQYQETRRSHHLIILDLDLSAYAEPDFELAVEIAASLCVSSLTNGQNISLQAGKQFINQVGAATILDFLTTLEPAEEAEPLPKRVARVTAAHPEISTCSVITGPENSLQKLQQICASTPTGLRVHGIRTDQGSLWHKREQGRVQLGTIGELSQLLRAFHEETR